MWVYNENMTTHIYVRSYKVMIARASRASGVSQLLNYMGRTASVVSFCLITVSFEARWWFQTFFTFIPIWGRFQF